MQARYEELRKIPTEIWVGFAPRASDVRWDSNTGQGYLNDGAPLAFGFLVEWTVGHRGFIVGRWQVLRKDYFYKAGDVCYSQ